MCAFRVEDCRSVSNRTGFECISPPGDPHSTKFEYGSHQIGETRGERFEWKHSIELSSVAFRCKSEHQYRETCGGNETNPIGTNLSHHNLKTSGNNVGHLEKVYSNVRQTLGRQPGDDMPEVDVNAMIWSFLLSQRQWKPRYILDKTIKRESAHVHHLKLFWRVRGKVQREDHHQRGTWLIWITDKAWPSMARDLVRNVKSSSTKGTASNGLPKNRSSTMRDVFANAKIFFTKNALEALHDVWSMSDSCVDRHHAENRETL